MPISTAGCHDEMVAFSDHPSHSLQEHRHNMHVIAVGWLEDGEVTGQCAGPSSLGSCLWS